MAATNHPKAQIVITSTAEPARCSRCEREIATWIVAATPANPRRHLVRVGTAYYTDNEGLPICPDCFPEYEQEQRMIWEIALRMFVEEDGQVDRPDTPRRRTLTLQARAPRRNRNTPTPARAAA